MHDSDAGSTKHRTCRAISSIKNIYVQDDHQSASTANRQSPQFLAGFLLLRTDPGFGAFKSFCGIEQVAG